MSPFLGRAKEGRESEYTLEGGAAGKQFNIMPRDDDRETESRDF